MLKSNLSPQVLKFLKKVPIKHAQQIARTLKTLAQQPMPHDAKKLHGANDYYRVDVGEYRVIYRIDTTNQMLIIAMVGKRNDSEVYKKFKRTQ